MVAFLHLIWPDLLALCVLAFFLRAAWHRGFLASILDLTGFGLSLGAATLAYLPLADFLSPTLHMSRGIAKSLAFMAIWWAAEAIAARIIRHAVNRLPKNVALSRWNRSLGTVVGLLEFAVILPFSLTLLASLPSPNYVATDINASMLSGQLFKRAAAIERVVSNLYGGAFQETLSYLTTDAYDDSLDLGFRSVELTVDADAERRMFDLVNAERAENGLPAYVWDERLSELARTHSADMLVRGYFSHTTPDGRTALQRAAALDGLRFRAVGENLAFAKDLLEAHNALLSSPGHRANILSSVFSRLGIGIEAAPGRGLMISQEFAD